MKIAVVTYPRKRWLLLTEFCILAFLQSSIFLSWNPIANSVLYAFGPDWTQATLAWQINLATITSPFLQYPVWKCLKRFNLAWTVRWLAVFPLVISSLLNSLPLFIPYGVSSLTYKWLTYVSFLFTGLTGVVFFSCVTRFSATWFYPNERATSTSLACMMANLGGILPSMIGPKLVSDPFRSSYVNPDSVAKEIYSYMLMYVILSILVFLMFWFYFPDNLDLANQEDLNNSVWLDCFKVLTSCRALCILFVASLGSIPHIWGSTLLTVTLSKLRITQEFIGYVTTLSLISSTIFTVILSRIADMCFSNRLKTLVMAMLPFHVFSMIGVSVCVLIGDPVDNYKREFF